MPTPLVATYRIQLGPGFAFNDAAAIVDYLSELGVSHLYCSPLLQAAPGSAHGYDVVDPTIVSVDLGGESGFTRLGEALRQAGMGLVVDIVPNHMAIRGRENAWWWDVLENGPAGLHASHFDVDWDPPESKFRDLILLPILGDRYGRVLQSCGFELIREGGGFVVRYGEHSLPVAPRSLESLLTAACARVSCPHLAFLADAFGRLPFATQTDPESVRRRHRDKAVLGEMLRRLCLDRADVAAAVDGVLENWNRSPEAMDAFLKRQNYRLTYWRNSERELGYRRFFDINNLAALRVEDERVFADTHAQVLRWVREGIVDGLRVDHIDGLRDPTAYLRRLRDAASDTWIVVEKILQPDESLPESWPVAGTTGYDFLNLIGGLFVRPDGEPELAEAYAEFTGEHASYAETIERCKKSVLGSSLGADLNRLTALLLRISETRAASQDFTRHELHELLREVLAQFPVYRTYVASTSAGLSRADETHIRAAIFSAQKRRPDLDSGLFSFLEDVLLGRLTGARETDFVQRFQQLSAPVMAKGVEDTAYYRFNRLVSLNEVGGDPGRFGTALERFHDACAAAQQRWPLSMLATATHDTKRGEDVRARLAVLSETPQAWAAAVGRWSKGNEGYKSGGLPDRNLEYLLYQTLVGAWPVSVERMSAYAIKAAREAKQFTSWTKEDPGYERALLDFVRGILADKQFIRELEAFVQPLIVPGRVNSLAQTLLKLTAPGVPDIYQGSELWDLSLVDPDNRRPVDYRLRRRLLSGRGDHGLTASAIIDDHAAVKLRLIARVLSVRRCSPEAFGPQGAYRAVHAKGSRREHVLAFARGERYVTVVPRWPLSIGKDWADTAVPLDHGRWRDELTGQELTGGMVMVHDLLKRFPLALLARIGG